MLYEGPLIAANAVLQQFFEVAVRWEPKQPPASDEYGKPDFMVLVTRNGTTKKLLLEVKNTFVMEKFVRCCTDVINISWEQHAPLPQKIAAKVR